MSNREQIISQIVDAGIVAIVRVPRNEWALPLARALVAGGIRAVELTMSIPNALDAIRQIDEELGGIMPRVLEGRAAWGIGKNATKMGVGVIKIPEL